MDGLAERILFIVSMNDQNNTRAFQKPWAGHTIWVLAIRFRGGRVLSLRYTLKRYQSQGLLPAQVFDYHLLPAPVLPINITHHSLSNYITHEALLFNPLSL